MKRALSVAIAFAVAVLPFALTGPAAAAGHEAIQGFGHPDAIEGSYLVVYRPGVRHGLDLMRDLPITARHTFSSAVRGFAARMDERQARLLAAHPDVAIVEQDRVVRLDTPPPAHTVTTMDTGISSASPYGPPLIPPPMGRGVTAYVIDTGILATHTSFSTAPVWGVNTVGGVNSDCNGHGTHVAGILGGSFNERWSSWNAQLVAVKVLGCNGSGSIASVVAGVDWVTAHNKGPAVANMSLGSVSSPSLDQAVRTSIASGITYVVAAGNANTDACHTSPARVGEAITVGAAHGLGRRAWFSNHGTCLDLFSHGVGVRSAWHTSTTATAVLSGTSMAAPQIASIASNYLSANLSATPAQVRAHVLAFAQPGAVIDPGPGSPNLLRIAHVNPFPSPPTAVSVNCDSSNQMMYCDASAGGTVTDFWWFIDGYPAASSPSLAIGCVAGMTHNIRVIAGNSGGAAETSTFVGCSGNPPV